ncbi:MAG: phospho-N-acetylmuramoyl-pentapeptide-transferase [Clostridiales bacterium]|nr:phospho-N-acetylmuramoyl-pentapeptide-transferase [Clostridiales bacterium]
MDLTINTAIYGALLAFLATVVLCPILIPYLTKLNFGQNVRGDGPKSHLSKAGTPTMGGIVIVIGYLFSSVYFTKGSTEVLAVNLVTLSFGIIGFIDDYIKKVKKRSLGLTAMQKIISQLLVAGAFAWFVYNNSHPYFGLNTTQILIPFVKGGFDLGFMFIPAVIFIVVGGVNSVNLTDGLDGLNSGVTALVAVFFVYTALTAGSPLVPAAGAAAGSLLAFLLFNSHPARVFMGDTGSLALGGFVTSVAVILKSPLFLALVGIIYVAEALSVIIQVGYFKLTHGKRVFKMAPIHHHFELSGFTETKVVSLFYIITAIAVLIGFLGFSEAL